MDRRRGGWTIVAGLLLAAGLLPGPARALRLRLAPDLAAPLVDPTAPVEALPRDQVEAAPVFGIEMHSVPEAAAPEPASEIESEPEFRPAWDRRVLGIQLLLQVGATAVSGITGLGVGAIYALTFDDGWGAIGAGAIGGLIMGLIVHPLATHFGGHWMRGRGTIWGTLLGFLAGAGGAVLLGVLAGSIWGVGSTLLMIGAVALFYSGSMVGYHLSHRLVHPDEPYLPLARLRF